MLAGFILSRAPGSPSTTPRTAATSSSFSARCASVSSNAPSSNSPPWLPTSRTGVAEPGHGAQVVQRPPREHRDGVAGRSASARTAAAEPGSRRDADGSCTIGASTPSKSSATSSVGTRASSVSAASSPASRRQPQRVEEVAGHLFTSWRRRAGAASSSACAPRPPGISSARATAALTPSVSCGFTSSALVSSRAAPVNSEHQHAAVVVAAGDVLLGHEVHFRRAAVSSMTSAAR